MQAAPAPPTHIAATAEGLSLGAILLFTQCVFEVSSRRGFSNEFARRLRSALWNEMFATF